MLFLSKKRISLIILGIFIIFLIFGIYYTKKNKKETIATVALPVNNKVIVIDAGHGNPDRRSF